MNLAITPQSNSNTHEDFTKWKNPTFSIFKVPLTQSKYLLLLVIGTAFIKWNFDASTPPVMTLRGLKILFDTWIHIAITYIMNFGIQATLMAELVLCDIYKVILITYTIKLWSNLGDLKNEKSWIFFHLVKSSWVLEWDRGVIARFMLPLWPPELI